MSAAARYGSALERLIDAAPSLLRDGYTTIPNAVLRRTDLSGNAKAMYAVMLDVVVHQRDEPTMEELGELVGGGVKTARKAIRDLETAGLLQVQKRGQGHPNRYTLLDPQTGPKGQSEQAETADPSMPVTRSEEVEMLTHLSSDIQKVYDHWRTRRQKTRTNYDTISPARRAKIKSRLGEFSAAELCAAIDGIAKDPWGERALHDDITVVFRSREQVERFLEMGSASKPATGSPYEQAQHWVRTVGWQYADAELFEELGRFGLEADERRRVAEVAMRMQESAA